MSIPAVETEDDITAPIFTADYDTEETVTCSAFFIYDKERQRSLQHFIQIENLPDSFDTVIITSGETSQDIDCVIHPLPCACISIQRDLVYIFYPQSTWWIELT